MRFTRLFLALSQLFLLCSCAALTSTNEHYNQTVSSWRWGSSSQLLHSWGNPSKIAQLPNGNRVYIYDKETYRTYPSSPPTSTINTVSVPTGRTVMVVPSPSAPVVASTFLLTCATTFEIDPRGIIVNVRAQGNSCTSDEGFSLEKSNPNARPYAAPIITVQGHKKHKRNNY